MALSDVDKILDESNQGWDFFEKMLPNLKKENKPFKERDTEGTPSARVTKLPGSDRYILKDFGGSKFDKGVDVFEFAKDYYNLTGVKDFPAVLEKIAGELNINLEKKAVAVSYIRPSYKTPEQANYNKFLAHWEGRRISKATIETYGIYMTKGWNPATAKDATAMVFPYTKDGELVNNKLKYTYTKDGKKKKTFTQEKQAEQVVFGLDQAAGKKTWVWVEGEPDVVSGYEALSQIEQIGKSYKAAFGKDLPSWTNSVGVVSPQNGSGDKLHCITNCIAWLDKVDTHIIFSDNDEAGEKLRSSLCERLPNAKVRVVKAYHGCNDSNDILCQRGAIYLLNSYVTSEYLPIKDVYTVADVKDSMMDFITGRTKLTEPLGWELDTIWRPMPGTITTVTGVPFSGKSTLVMNMVAKAFARYGYPTLWYGSEEPNAIKQSRMVGTFFGTPYMHGTKEFNERFNESDFGYATDSIGDMMYWLEPEENAKVDYLEEKIKEMHFRLGIGIAVIDPFTSVESSKGYDRKETVRELLSMANRVAKELNIHIIVVAHPTKMEQEKVGDIMVYKKVHPYNIAESSNWFNGSAFLLGTYRGDPTSPITEVYSMKVKFPFDGMKVTSMRVQFDIITNRFFAEGLAANHPFYRTIYEEDWRRSNPFDLKKTLKNKVDEFVKYKFSPKTLHSISSSNEEETPIEDTLAWSNRKFEISPNADNDSMNNRSQGEVSDADLPF